ncbi:MAG: NADH-quinone oxidoreductase subunit J [Fimbriimonadaceae bacterium]|nr:NADH-quinone oxidoreductase subunit J [Fimbriimonadaceae bacterium]QYK56811.1 MAG: NADH-quinone oxidoreductase subunit J [Fimbriimonadaceae bacterium]
MNAGKVVFFILAAVALLSALGLVAFGKNPVRAAIMLVLNFFTLAIMYFSLGAQLLGITQIMVYAGAIMVLFLFVIMVLQNQGAMERIEEKTRDRKGILALLGALALWLIVHVGVIVPISTSRGSRVADDYGSPQAIGTILFTTYAWPFLVASVLLLVGIVGSILLAKRRL